MKRIKNFVFPVAVLAISWYISFLFVLGIIIGHISTNYYHKKVAGKPRLQQVYIPFFRWKIHFHHWLMGVVAILIFWVTGVLNVVPHIILGMTGGIIFNDFYSYDDWHKIVLKK